MNIESVLKLYWGFFYVSLTALIILWIYKRFFKKKPDKIKKHDTGSVSKIEHKTVGDVIEQLQKFPKDALFVAHCVDMGGYSEHFEISEKMVELNYQDYTYYGGEHVEHDEYHIEEYNPLLTKVVTLSFKDI